MVFLNSKAKRMHKNKKHGYFEAQTSKYPFFIRLQTIFRIRNPIFRLKVDTDVKLDNRVITCGIDEVARAPSTTSVVPLPPGVRHRLVQTLSLLLLVLPMFII